MSQCNTLSDSSVRREASFGVQVGFTGSPGPLKPRLERLQQPPFTYVAIPATTLELASSLGLGRRMTPLLNAFDDRIEVMIFHRALPVLVDDAQPMRVDSVRRSMEGFVPINREPCAECDSS